MGNCPSYNSIYEQYQRTELLIGLKPNSKLPELNAILQCLCHIEPIINYFRYKYEQIKKIDSFLNIFSSEEKYVKAFDNKYLLNRVGGGINAENDEKLRNLELIASRKTRELKQ